MTRFVQAKNRDRLSIVAAVLEAVNTGSNKTGIMFSANLSFKLLEKYLEVVLDSGLVSLSDSRYMLTPVGRTFLRRYGTFSKKYTKIQSLLNKLENEHEKLVRLAEKPAGFYR